MLIEKYTADWIKNFLSIKGEIEKVLGKNVYDIEHVVNTSVPGLDSKPIIDIDIIYTKPEDFEKIKLGLQIKYQQMKCELAYKANQDKKTYQALKELHVNDFIDSILVK